MKTAIVTGCCGLVGAEAVRLLSENGYLVVGIDNDMRRYFFGPDASTFHRAGELESEFTHFRYYRADIRKETDVQAVFEREQKNNVELVVHTAAQPSHDWAAKEPLVDFDVNARGTLNLLEATRRFLGTHTTFAHISTSKVYGDNPNRLPLVGRSTRLDLPAEHPFYDGITTEMDVDGDNCLHSLFGVSKLSGDLIVQEYGRYFTMPTVCFRPGCVTGPGHAGAELHGFLSYLMKCAVTGKPYKVYGYGGLQVRCNIYARDLAAACLAFHEAPSPGAVYNIGGGRANAVSMQEAIEMCERITGNQMNVSYVDEPRIGDHRWWISSNRDFELDFPGWHQTRTVMAMLTEIAEAA